MFYNGRMDYAALAVALLIIICLIGSYVLMEMD
jgi:hypothetical protein